MLDILELLKSGKKLPEELHPGFVQGIAKFIMDRLKVHIDGGTAFCIIAATPAPTEAEPNRMAMHLAGNISATETRDFLAEAIEQIDLNGPPPFIQPPTQ